MSNTRQTKKNYRPLSIMLDFSEKFMKNYVCKNDEVFFEIIFSKYQFGFCKEFTTQQCHLAIFKKWRKAVYRVKAVAASIINLSKAFYCLDYETLIVKPIS